MISAASHVISSFKLQRQCYIIFQETTLFVFSKITKSLPRVCYNIHFPHSNFQYPLIFCFLYLPLPRSLLTCV